MDPDDLTVDKKENNIHFMFWLESRVRRTRDPSFGKTNDDDVDLGWRKRELSTMGRNPNPQPKRKRETKNHLADQETKPNQDGP